MWRFRQWMVKRTTFTMIGLGCLLFLLFIFMLTQVVETNDDIMNSVVFMTLSVLPLIRVLFCYYDDLAIDLNDYLYGTAGDSTDGQLMLAKGSRWSSFERRWSFMRSVKLGPVSHNSS